MLPLFLSEINKNNFVSQEDLAKIVQHANQILEYPFVQEFLTKHLPKILLRIVGTQQTSIPVQVNEPAKQTEKTPTEQLYDLCKPFMNFAQNLATNVSLPNLSLNESQIRSDTDFRAEQTVPQTSNSVLNQSRQPQVIANPNLNKSPAVPVARAHQTPTVEAKRVFTIFLRELAQLKELGFPESDGLVELLNDCCGDISAVIDELNFGKN